MSVLGYICARGRRYLRPWAAISPLAGGDIPVRSV